MEILEAKGDTAKPVFTILMAFKTELAKWLENIPFDLTIVQGNPVVYKIVRNRCKTADYVTVTVHSTHEFAAKSVNVYGSKSSVARLQGKESHYFIERCQSDLIYTNFAVWGKLWVGP